MSFQEEEKMSVEGGLRILEEEIDKKEREYAEYKRLYPLLRKVFERYGSYVYHISWYSTRMNLWFEKRLTGLPPKFTRYLEELGLDWKDAEFNSVGHYSIDITGLRKEQ